MKIIRSEPRWRTWARASAVSPRSLLLLALYSRSGALINFHNFAMVNRELLLAGPLQVGFEAPFATHSRHNSTAHRSHSSVLIELYVKIGSGLYIGGSGKTWSPHPQPHELSVTDRNKTHTTADARNQLGSHKLWLREDRLVGNEMCILCLQMV